MKNAVIAARILLALPFLVFGLNHYLGFMEQPQHPPDVAAFLIALNDSNYVWPIVKATEVLAGVMLLLGQWVPLALVLLTPILVNIVGFHFCVDLDNAQGLAIAVVLAVLHLFLVISYMGSFRGILMRVPEESHE